MTDYSELVKALRCKRDDCEGCDLAFFDNDEGWMCQYAAKDDDAADAIEALQAENTDIREELFVSQREYDNFVAVASMENAMLAKQIPNRGKWIMDGKYTRHCSICNESVAWPEKFCPNCGAKMEVQE